MHTEIHDMKYKPIHLKQYKNSSLTVNQMGKFLFKLIKFLIHFML